MRLPQRSKFLHLESPNPKGKVLIIGESTAAGVGASTKETTIAYQLFKLKDESLTVYNLGKNGLRAENLQGLLAFGKPDVSTDIDVAIILIGANDCFKFTPPSRFYQILKEFIHLLVQVKSIQKVIIPPIPPVQQFPSIPNIMRFYLGWHRKILNRELDALNEAIPELQIEKLEESFPNNFFAEDGIHPSDLGYEQMAKLLAEKVIVAPSK